MTNFDLSPEGERAFFEARRDALLSDSAHGGEMVLFPEPLEYSDLWAVPRDPVLEGEAGARILMNAQRRLRPFFEQFAHEQATGTGPKPEELTQRLDEHISQEIQEQENLPPAA